MNTHALLLGAMMALLPVTDIAEAQSWRTDADFSSRIILPQRRMIRIAAPDRQEAVIEKVSVRAVAREALVETVMELTIKNPGASMIEAEILLPVREGAIFKSFSYGSHAGQYPATLMPAGEARKLYDRIVARAKDPALLEFAGYGVVRTSVFPIPARSSMQVRVIYEEVLENNNGRFDYVLPRSEAFDQTAQWDIRMEIETGKQGKAVNVYSPSHEIEVNTLQNANRTVALKKSNLPVNPGHFRLSWQHQSFGTGNAISNISLFACPDSDQPDTGYFLLMCSPEYLVEGFISKDIKMPRLKREVTLVLDRSGSMRGEKLDKVRESVKQIIAALDEGETFNILTYNQGVDSFRDQPVVKNPVSERDAFEWLDTLTANGGTNIHEALSTALGQPVSDGTLPLVLFLTDGQPTIGQTSERMIVKLIDNQNPGKRRVFSVGVGTDLNAPLLRRLSSASGAACAFIAPGEDVEVAIADLFAKLHGPLATDLDLSVGPSRGRVRDMLPARLPDLYAGSQLIITGQYIGTEPLTITLSGRHGGKQKALSSIGFDPTRIASISDDFVPRLWATRQIAALQESLRDMDIATNDIDQLMVDPRTKEITEEIVRLSTRFGIMSDFTSFFADDRALGAIPPARRREAFKGFVTERAGADAFAMEANIEDMKSSSILNKSNIRKEVVASDSAAPASIASTANREIYQIGQNSFTRNNGVWFQNDAASPTDQHDIATVVVGTPEYNKVVDQLVRENRQGVLAIDGTVKLRLNKRIILLQNTINP